MTQILRSGVGNMEGNKDESERCILLAEKHINDGQREKATKYLQKAERLYPSQRAKDLLDFLTKLNDTLNMNDHATKQNGNVNNVRNRNVSAGGDGGVSSSSASEAKHEYTSEQLDAVKRIKKSKDYYEILGVTKEATDSELKKMYRKMALQFHPDKNKAPGATEAFKAIGNAFAILTDPEKRKRYDLYGAEDEQRSRSTQRRNSYYEHDYTRGFEAEMTAEELFNMFFGGSFNSGNVYMRRGNRWTRYREQHPQQTEQREQTSYSALLQLLPILLLIALSLTSSFFVSEPPYSLQQSLKFSIARTTDNMHIPYYVKDTFAQEYKDNIRRVEQQVEDEYVNGLRQACFREMNYKESLLWRARSFGDGDLMQKANSMKMPSCDTLRKLQNSVQS